MAINRSLSLTTGRTPTLSTRLRTTMAPGTTTIQVGPTSPTVGGGFVKPQTTAIPPRQTVPVTPKAIPLPSVAKPFPVTAPTLKPSTGTSPLMKPVAGVTQTRTMTCPAGYRPQAQASRGVGPATVKCVPIPRNVPKAPPAPTVTSKCHAGEVLTKSGCVAKAPSLVLPTFGPTSNTAKQDAARVSATSSLPPLPAPPQVNVPSNTEVQVQQTIAAGKTDVAAGNFAIGPTADGGGAPIITGVPGGGGSAIPAGWQIPQGLETALPDSATDEDATPWYKKPRNLAIGAAALGLGYWFFIR